jgi:hypothetical protein
MPSAPKSRATLASSPVSALARSASLPSRIRSAHRRMLLKLGGGSASGSAISPSTISPLVPSSEMVVALGDGDSAGGELVARILDGSAPTHGRDAPAARHDGGVADEAALGG